MATNHFEMGNLCSNCLSEGNDDEVALAAVHVREVSLDSLMFDESKFSLCMEVQSNQDIHVIGWLRKRAGLQQVMMKIPKDQDKCMLKEAKIMQFSREKDGNLLVPSVLGVINEDMRFFFKKYNDICDKLDEIHGTCSVNMALLHEYEPDTLTLREFISTSRFAAMSYAERLGLITSLAKGLYYLHNSSCGIIVHGKLTSSNVLLTEHHSAMLINFSSSHIINRDDLLSTSDNNTPEPHSVLSNHKLPNENEEDQRYFAPEMYGEKIAVTSRKTDIYAFGVLMMEVLVGKLIDEESWPWEDKMNGKLPLLLEETFPTSAELIKSCLSDRPSRPYIGSLRIDLEQELVLASDSKFDIFLSYAWGRGDIRKPLADQIFLELCSNKYKVWMDTTNMKRDLKKDMSEGIINSDAAVILLSPDYLNSSNCRFELQRIQSSLGSLRVVVCIVESDSWMEWKTNDGANLVGYDLVEFFGLKEKLYPDFSDLSKISCTDDFEMRRLLLEPKAMPRLLNSLKVVAPNSPRKVKPSDSHEVAFLMEQQVACPDYCSPYKVRLDIDS